jgi:hypothetical protein
MNDLHLVLHALAIKKHADAEAVANLCGLDDERVQALLLDAASRGRAVRAQGKFMLTPTAQMALRGDYSRYYGSLRANSEFLTAYELFERINVKVKSLITDWQTMVVADNRIPNDHSDKDYDVSVIDRLGRLHEQCDRIVTRLAAQVSRMQIYQRKLVEALEHAEAGQIEWISDYKIDSYHTVWFELHEDLLRLAGRTRLE